MKSVYTFYINDENAETKLWGCVATSQDAAENLAQRAGFRDFFLWDQRPLEAHETDEHALASIVLNPNLGPQWIPIVGAIQMLTERLSSRSSWTIQTYAKKYGFSPDTSPYIQAILNEDNGLHLEVSGNIIVSPKLGQREFEHLAFIGWTLPSDESGLTEGELAGLPNPYRSFDPGWNAKAVAEFALETLLTVYGVEPADYFNFGETWEPKAIAELGSLHRLDKHDGNPAGSIFQLVQPIGLEESSERDFVIPARVKFKGNDPRYFEKLFSDPGQPLNSPWELFELSDDNLAIAIFVGYFFEKLGVEARTEFLEIELERRAKEGQPVSPRIFNSIDLQLEELQGRAIRAHRHILRLAEVSTSDGFGELYQELKLLSDDELSELIIAAFSFPPVPLKVELKVLLDAALSRFH